jgi:sugar (glycoside-pentoside-hexuronide) transporter
MELVKETGIEEKLGIQKISVKELVAYFCYGFGQVLNYAMVGTYLTIFYTDYLKISASIAGVIFLIARIWDAINDPMMAALIDYTNSPKGKFRFWLKWISIFIVLTTILTFIPWNLKGSVLIGVAGISYILWGMVYTVSDVPFWSLSTAMSNDAQERSKAVTVANTGVSLGFLFPPLVVPLFSKFIGHNLLGVEGFGNAAFMAGLPYGIMAIAVLTYPLMLFGYIGTKERRHTSVEKVKIKDMINTVRTARPLFVICSIFISSVFWDLQGALLTYFFIVNLGNIDYQSTVTFFSLFAYATLVLYPVLTRRFKKKRILQAQLILDTLIRLPLLLFGYSNVTLVLAVIVALNFLQTLTSALIPNMIGECVEYCEYKTGKRTEGIVFSFQTFSGKLKTAIALGVSGFALTLIHYNPNAAEQTTTVANGIFFVCLLLPILGNVIKFILSLFIRYTEDEYRLVVRFLEKKYQKADALKADNKELAQNLDTQMQQLQEEITQTGLK